MTNTILTIGAGLLGVIVGSTSSWLLVRRQYQLSTILDMHREFNSGDLARSRHVASKLVAQHQSKTYHELYQELSAENMHEIWCVVYFYQRLWLLIKYHQVRSKYVTELFADVFYYRLALSFERQLIPDDVPVAGHIAELRGWLDNHTTEQDRQRWRTTDWDIVAEGNSRGFTWRLARTRRWLK
jgi:hypothetical protein